MTAYDDWVARDAVRRAPEVDFGTTWRRLTDVEETWRVSWNSGSGELIAVTRSGDDVEVLGRFNDLDEVVDTLFEWKEQVLRVDGLDDVRRMLVRRARVVGNAWPAPVVTDREATEGLAHPEPDTGWAEAERDYRRDMADLAQQRREEERDPPRWQEYLATCDRRVDVDGHVEWRPLIDLDYDEWDRVSRHPDWNAYLESIPDDAVRAEPFEDWLSRNGMNRHGSPVSPPPKVYGMVIRPDGSTSPLFDPVTVDVVEQHVDAECLDLAKVHHGLSSSRSLHMVVDDTGHAKGLQVNPLATLLYGSGWPILGTVVLCDDDGQPLPHALADGLSTNRVPTGPGPGHHDVPGRLAPHRPADDIVLADPEPDQGMDLS